MVLPAKLSMLILELRCLQKRGGWEGAGKGYGGVNSIKQ